MRQALCRDTAERPNHDTAPSALDTVGPGHDTARPRPATRSRARAAHDTAMAGPGWVLCAPDSVLT